MDEKYINGLDMEQFTNIKEISNYNSNYYVGFDKDLLYGKSDDDNTTEWFLIKNPVQIIFLGYSLCSDKEKLNRTKHRCT